MRKKCRPHSWRLPGVGDDALAYEACDRRIDYRAELTKLKYVSIVNAYEARRGAVAGQRFRTALIAAWAAESDCLLCSVVPSRRSKGPRRRSPGAAGRRPPRWSRGGSRP